MVSLFVYGTLREPHVQNALFGRTLEVIPTVLDGFCLERVELHDEAVVRLSGTTKHVILRPGSPEEIVSGWTIALTKEELEIADAYEPNEYSRIKVLLRGGEEAFAYVDAVSVADTPGS